MNRHLGKVVASRPEAAETKPDETAVIKVGDRVTGYKDKGNKDRLTTGIVAKIVMGQYGYIDLGENGAIWTEGARLDPLPATEDTNTTTKGTSMSNTINFAFPAGKVDFTKLIRDVDSKDAATVLNVLSGDYPILIETGGQAYLVDGDGEDRDGSSIVENLPAMPDVMLYGAIYTNTYEDAGYSISDTLYTSAKNALDNHNGEEDFIGIIEINPMKQQAGAAPVATSGTTATTTTASDDGDESEGDTTADTGPKELSIYLGNYGTRTVRVGDMLRAHRKGFGTRTVEVKKLRNDRTKSVLVQANDGTGAYWAFNKNLSLSS